LVAPGAQAPSLAHPFGTDLLGRDLLARTASGAWASTRIGAGALGAALLVAVPLGLLAGWRQQRRTDGWIMRVLEAAQVVPMFVLVLFLLSIVGHRSADLGVVRITSTAWVALCLAVGFVPFFARVTRAATIVETEHEYVDGLRVLGVPNRAIVVRE